jgi:hypothetical protein
MQELNFSGFQGSNEETTKVKLDAMGYISNKHAGFRLGSFYKRKEKDKNEMVTETMFRKMEGNSLRLLFWGGTRKVGQEFTWKAL